MGTQDRFKKGMLDPLWRLENIYKIITKESEKVTFTPNKIQQVINASKARRKIVLKARQFGVTTNCVLELLDYTMFNRNVTSVILAHEADAIKKIFRIVKRAYKFMHPDLKPRIDRGGGSKYEMYFPEINSLIYCDLESRGDTINRLHVSEAAFMEQDRYISTLQAVPLNGSVTIESTPNGMENFFYEMWIDESRFQPYEKLFFPWFFHDEYKILMGSETVFLDKTFEEETFIKNAKKNFGKKIEVAQLRYRRFKQAEIKEKYIQEYPEDDVTCFISSGGAVCNQQIIKDLINECKKPIFEDETLKIFSKTKAGLDYVIGADPAEGVGGDYSTASVICVQKMEEVAFYRGQCPPFQFAKKLEEICKTFSTGGKTPLLAVESNNHGHAVLLELREHLRYPNLYWAKKDRVGWVTTSITRPIMVDQCIESIQEGYVTVHSRETLREITTLVTIRGKIQAADKKHDDSFMATAIAVQMVMKNVDKIRLYENVSAAIRV